MYKTKNKVALALFACGALFSGYLEAKNPESKPAKSELTPAQERASMTLYEETYAGGITLERVAELVKQGAKVDFVDASGLSIRDQAVFTGNVAVAEYLKQKSVTLTEQGLNMAMERVMTAAAQERELARKTLAVYAKEGVTLKNKDIAKLNEAYVKFLGQCYAATSYTDEEKKILAENPEAESMVKLHKEGLQQLACEAKSRIRMVLQSLNQFKGSH